jgi:hypothetical protein
MGTPSMTKIFDDGKLIAAVYLQCDGYPSSAGKDLAAFMATGKLVNGLGGVPKGYKTVFNGMGCFAAAYVAKLKDGPGHTYLVAPEVWRADYVYEVRENTFKEDEDFTVACKSGRKTLFKQGSLADFAKFCANSED